jgi:hypothetical protein
MKHRTILLAYCLLTFGDLALSQAPAPTSNPITGLWTGQMVGGPNRATINVELKYDGKTITGTVSGPELPRPADIKTGSFDAKTGALKFQAVIRGDEAIVRFEGTVAQGDATGKVFLPDSNVGEFKISKKAAGSAGSAGTSAPNPPPPAKPGSGDEAQAAARRGFVEVSGWVSRAVDLVPAEKFTYRPVGTVRTFGQLVAHVVDGYAYYCGRAAGRSAQWSDVNEKGATTKAVLVPKLKQALDACNAVYGGTGQIGPMFENVAHASLHYGNIVTYMRMLGLTPPSS